MHLLFSARDPGSVGFLLPILDACELDKRFTVSIVASDPALSLLKAKDKRVTTFPTTAEDGHIDIQAKRIQVIDEARFLLDKVKPDVIITSSSSLGVGIDEGLLAVANVPTITVQDFWGDVNLGLNNPANTYLVIDELAARMSKERWGVSAIPVGACKYTAYENINIDELRNNTRSTLGIEQNQLLVGFFGQSPQIPGHNKAFKDLVSILSEMTNPPTLLRRDHPKFASNHTHDNLIRTMGITEINVTNKGEAEPWLCACDIVTTCYSYVSIDHAYLSSKSRDPIGLVLFLLHNANTKQYFEKTTGLSSLPTVSRGIGLEATSIEDIRSLLQSLDLTNQKRSYHKASQKLTTENSVNQILDIIAKAGRA
ncbi:MAG: hypothetical protein CL785_02815 [Chloroflexi bacterium]|nr:hypothetical protein [Chloroflexota bacterium]|tara:strand:- start:1894 stop:3000 length:1107 start_codon:yes stop_codon:yes gene_type:complete